MAHGPDLDDALLTATRHAHTAEGELVEEAPTSPIASDRADTVEHFAEDIHVLAVDLVDHTADGGDEHGRQG